MPLNRMPRAAKWVWYGPTWRALLILVPLLWIVIPLLLPALGNDLRGYAPGDWSGWPWQ
jgi:hypothetical protein